MTLIRVKSVVLCVCVWLLLFLHLSVPHFKTPSLILRSPFLLNAFTHWYPSPDFFFNHTLHSFLCIPTPTYIFSFFHSFLFFSYPFLSFIFISVFSSYSFSHSYSQFCSSPYHSPPRLNLLLICPTWFFPQFPSHFSYFPPPSASRCFFHLPPHLSYPRFWPFPPSLLFRNIHPIIVIYVITPVLAGGQVTASLCSSFKIYAQLRNAVA